LPLISQFKVNDTRTDAVMFTQRRSVAKNVGYFQRRLFVCGCVCQHDDFRTSKRDETWGLVHCTKISAEFEFGVIDPVGVRNPQKCGVLLSES